MRALHHFDLNSLEVKPHLPQVLHSEGEGRSIALLLPAGEELQEHEVHERAWLVVVDGEVEVRSGGESRTAGAGNLFVFDPHEQHEVSARTEARLLLVLAPWPGKGREGDGDRLASGSSEG